MALKHVKQLIKLLLSNCSRTGSACTTLTRFAMHWQAGSLLHTAASGISSCHISLSHPLRLCVPPAQPTDLVYEEALHSIHCEFDRNYRLSRCSRTARIMWPAATCWFSETKTIFHRLPALAAAPLAGPIHNMHCMLMWTSRWCRYDQRHSCIALICSPFVRHHVVVGCGAGGVVAGCCCCSHRRMVAASRTGRTIKWAPRYLSTFSLLCDRCVRTAKTRCWMNNFRHKFMGFNMLLSKVMNYMNERFN